MKPLKKPRAPKAASKKSGLLPKKPVSGLKGEKRPAMTISSGFNAGGY